jgi:hypothetical protein
MDPHRPGYPITDSYPFRCPIIAIAPFTGPGPIVFILLRNYDFFIFRIPELVRFGCLAFPLSCQPQRSILRRASVFSPAVAGPNPIATATIRFAEGRVCIAVHPKFIALHISSDVIHVLSLESNEIITIPVHEPSVVDFIFLVTESCDCRLVYLADWKNGRRLHFLTLKSDESGFAEDSECDVPDDAHALLPLRGRALIVFTRNGIIRISAPPDGPVRTEDHVSVFLPFNSVVLRSCRMFGDVYLICDSLGGLTAGRFPAEGKPRTEFLRQVGPAAAIVAIDRSRFVVGSPFGDAVVYEWKERDDCFSVVEIKRIPAIGPIASLSIGSNGMLCATGKGENGALCLFGDSLMCTKVAEMAVSNCDQFFIASIARLIYVCLCFSDSAHVIAFAGSELARPSWTSDPVLYFAECDGVVLLVTDDAVKSVVAENGTVLWERTFFPQITAAAHFGSNIAIADTAGEVHILQTTDGTSTNNFILSSEPLFIAVCDDLVAVVCLDNTVTCLTMPDLTPISVMLPTNVVPVSIAFHRRDVLVGTVDGCLYQFTSELAMAVERLGDRPVMLRGLPDGSVIGTGFPAFQLADSRTFFCQCDFPNVAKAGDCLCGLDTTGISISDSKTQPLDRRNSFFTSPGLCGLWLIRLTLFASWKNWTCSSLS